MKIKGGGRYMKKEPLGIEVKEILEMTFRVKDDSLMPDRIVKEYQTPEGKFIGKYDPLDQFSTIVADTYETHKS